MQWGGLFFLALIIMVLDKTVMKSKKSKNKKPYHTDFASKVNPKDITNYAALYHRVPLLTDREQKQYQKLKILADEKKVLICPKVRLLDLVTPRPGLKNYQTLLRKVMSKHVDFVICSQDMQVLGIIELDDTTHLRKDRIERDEFVDSVLTGSGYKIIHTWEITSDILDTIQNDTPIKQSEIKITSPTGWIWNENTKLWEPPPGFK